MEQTGGESERLPAVPKVDAESDLKPPLAGQPVEIAGNVEAAAIDSTSSKSISQANRVGDTSTAVAPSSGTAATKSAVSGQKGDMVQVVVTSTSTAATTTTTATTATATPTSTIASNAATSQEKALIDSLIDDVIFCECLQVHRAAKMGFIFTEPGEELYKIRDGNGLDVFGQPLARPKKQLNCTCPQCGRNIGASRLAPHLEKCMGMGRLSSRAASNKSNATS